MKIILFGGGEVLLDFCRYLLKKEKFTKVDLITSKRHSEEIFSNKKFFEECKKIESEDFFNKFKFFVKSNLDDEEVNKLYSSSDLAISIGSAWIFKKKHIKKFKYLFNLHSTALPKWGGGGGSSWRIMCSERITAVTLHKIEEGIDTGNIIFQKKIELPENCITPHQNNLFIKDISLELLKEFIEKFISKEINLDGKKQNFKNSSYFPRLYTDVNACINWNWNAKQICSFINAFDDPYNGAFTSVAGTKIKVHLKKCEVIKGPNLFHPYQSGIIYRIDKSNYHICAIDGSLLVKEINFTNNIYRLKIGDRLYSSMKDIELSLNTKINYTPDGLVIKNNTE